MATITIRTDKSTDEVLDKLERIHASVFAKRNTIIKAALLAFDDLEPRIRAKYLSEVRSRDGRRVVRHFYY